MMGGCREDNETKGLIVIDDVKLDGEGGREVEVLATRIIVVDIL